MASLPYLRQTIRPFTTSLPTTLSASSRVAPSSAAFSTSSIQRALKESDRNRDNLPNEYESHKEETIKEVKSGKGYWKEQLASESEAGVKADRGESSTAGVDDIVKGAKEAALKKQKK